VDVRGRTVGDAHLPAGEDEAQQERSIRILDRERRIARGVRVADDD